MVEALRLAGFRHKDGDESHLTLLHRYDEAAQQGMDAVMYEESTSLSSVFFLFVSPVCLTRSIDWPAQHTDHSMYVDPLGIVNPAQHVDPLDRLARSGC